MPVLKRSLSINEVPDVQKEPYVLTGYRPPYRPWRFYLMSIFSQHNETVNVWTHLIPCFYVVYLLKTYSDEVSFANDVSSMLLLLLGISNFTIQFLSACAHLLHSRSVAAYYVTFIFDFLGIAFYAFSCGIVLYFLSSEASFSHAVHPWFPWTCVVLSCCYFAANAYSHVRYTRYHSERAMTQAVSFTITYLCSTSPVIHRIYSDIYNGRVDGVTWMHIVHILLVPIGGFFHVSEMPQSFFPGFCDVIGHGHQIFHVIMSTSFMIQLEASFTDLQNRRHLDLVRIRPTNLSITAYLVVLFTSYGYIAAIFVRKALSKAKS
ncbi:membrane progestin receptor alpha-like [Branchiostoma floridae]|uniref:Membrane progestin receptor alpha-like n=1 Tax=Branchiostoma floridae TaxID=7739 RepID=A0A9J7KW54_BRAFL|nr:membrane progestin receptor alpha-like [Branchiostoma floridae]XP_035671650.1 membrane progestin receptor alpha-like [Branchiostoma floridae]XP_035671652.1 membrane progestin receptor alpha-like [Branchiostoma floridae]